MEQRFELKISFVIIVSSFIHLVLLVSVILPLFRDLAAVERMMADSNIFSGRDIIVNINQDDKRVFDQKTLLSDRDSTASGYITTEKGNKWLNNSLEFAMKHGKSGSQTSHGSAAVKTMEKLLVSSDSEISVRLSAEDPYGNYGFDGSTSSVRIPDRWDITKQNALFYSTDGRFSFNTAKFKNFEYFRSMKNKIAANWFPPMIANSVILGGAPGYTRIMAIPSQEVKMFFIMDRTGEVRDVKIVDSMGNTPLDRACVDSIILSKNFGKVPEDLKGEFIVIPFIFGYYIR